MSPPVLIVFEQLNYTEPDSIHAIFMPVIIEFSRYIRIYSSAKFEFFYIKKPFNGVPALRGPLPAGIIDCDVQPASQQAGAPAFFRKIIGQSHCDLLYISVRILP